MTATATGAGTRALPRVRPRLRDFRFDPRLVLAGLLLLGSGTVGGFALAGVAQQAADDVAVPVAALCQQGGPTGVQLADTGACTAAGNTSVGPFQSELVTGPEGPAGGPGEPGADSQVPGPSGPPGADSQVPGSPGKAGEPGTPGAAGQDGTDGVSPACLSEPGQCRGPAGTNGVDGQSPPCLAEPAQCRGRDGTDGRDGADGAAGPPGPTCPDGTTLQPVMFADGKQGLGCVSGNADPEGGG